MERIEEGGFLPPAVCTVSLNVYRFARCPLLLYKYIEISVDIAEISM
jgi:hypothetical protein